MMAWLTSIVGERLARPVLGVAILLALISTLGVARCVYEARKDAQTRQGVQSSEAIANAAQDAIAIVGNRADAETAIDIATRQAKEEIGNAQNPDDINRAVAGAICMYEIYRNDPACQMR